MKACLMIEGVKIELELTNSQLQELGIGKNTSFGVKPTYYAADILGFSGAIRLKDSGNAESTKNKKAANYFENSEIARQVSLHQLLYRKLLKFAHENNCLVDPNLNHNAYRYTICRDANGAFIPKRWFHNKVMTVDFRSYKSAVLAINQVVYPFIAEHPDFVW